MKLKRLGLVLVLASFTATPLFAAEGGAELLGRLKESKHSLLKGIAQSEEAHGKAISAKFEMKDNTLVLSVYTAGKGLDKDAEHNEMIELIGDATQARWSPEKEVFEDAEHLKRSAMQLTLVQSSKLSLVDAVKKAESATQGKVYSAIPAVHSGVPVYDILVVTSDGKSKHLSIDGNTGNSRET
jgi:uncharacterized membrane protein YkoI